MRLFTCDQLEQLIENGQPHHRGKDWQPVAKLVLPGTPCAWLLSEIRLGDSRLYGYGISDFGTGSVQSGHIDLTEIERMVDPINADPVRVDETFIPCYPISVYLTAARMGGALTDDFEALQEAFDYEYSCNATPASFEVKKHLKFTP